MHGKHLPLEFFVVVLQGKDGMKIVVAKKDVDTSRKYFFFARFKCR